MPRFEELTVVVDKALRLLETTLDVEASDLEGDFVDPGAEDFDPAESEIKPDDEILFELPRSDVEPAKLTYDSLKSFAEEVSKAKLVDNLECWTPKRLLVRVEHTGSYDGYLKLNALLAKDVTLQSISVGDCAYELYLDSETTIFGFMVLKSGNWEKYFPPATHEDVFIGVRWRGTHDRHVVQRLIDGFIFEVASSLEVFLRRTPRPVIDFDHDEEGHMPTASIRELRPLLHGEGVSEAINLYTSAIGTHDPEFQVIGLVKVLEHISETVVREDLAGAVRTKLLSSRALDPNAEFILELESIITAHTKQHRKDSDALRLTIAKCCEATELANHAPEHLSLAGIKAATKEKEKLTALADFASCLSATRNEKVHAKLNYEKTGDECPPEHIGALASASRVAAEQAIRWYALQHDSVRVSRSPT